MQMNAEVSYKIREIDNALDSGCYACYKCLLYLSVINGACGLFLITYSPLLVLHPLVGLISSILILQGMQSKSKEKVFIGFVLTLVQTITLIIYLVTLNAIIYALVSLGNSLVTSSSYSYTSSSYTYSSSSSTSPLNSIYASFTLVCVMTFALHLLVNVFPAYKVWSKLKEREALQPIGALTNAYNAF